MGNRAPGALNWMTHLGSKSGPSLEVRPSGMAAGEEEMEEKAQPVYHTCGRQEQQEQGHEKQQRLQQEECFDLRQGR